eukprot:gene11587-8250_t
MASGDMDASNLSAFTATQSGTHLHRLASTPRLRRRSSAVTRQPSSSLALDARRKGVTLLATNRVGFLAALSRHRAAEAAAAGFCAVEVARITEAAERHNGVVGSFAADRCFVNFGAARPCAGHKECAADAVADIAHPRAGGTAVALDAHVPDGGGGGASQADEHPESVLTTLLTICAGCCGEAVCGNFGTDSLRSYMLIGQISSVVMVLERLATGWSSTHGVPVGVPPGRCAALVDDTLNDAAQIEYRCRLRARVQYQKRSSTSPLR